MKILASDFDNTLFFSKDSEKTQKNIEAIKNFMSQGNIFCLITGRTYMEIKPELNRIELPYTYLICGDGAMTLDSTDYCLQTVGLEKQLVEKVVNYLKKEGYAPYLEDGYNITDNFNDCIKVVAEYTDKEQANKVVKIINETMNVYAYASRKHINVNNKNNDKKQALQRLAELENLSLKDFYVIGDDINDLEMLTAYNGAIITIHNPDLDKLNLPQYDTLYDYVNYLLNE